jgi:hypothetical protein
MRIGLGSGRAAKAESQPYIYKDTHQPCPKSDLRCVEVLAPEEQHVYSPQVPDFSAPLGAAC